MTPAPLLPRVDLGGPSLVLHPEPGPEVDVVVLDLTSTPGTPGTDVADRVRAAAVTHPGPVGVEGGPPHRWPEALAAGVGLVVVDLDNEAGRPDPQAVADLVRSGVVVVVHHHDPAEAVAACDHLAAAGIDTARVVVEVGPHADVVAQATTLERSAFGFRVGARLGPVTGRPLLHHHAGLVHPDPAGPPAAHGDDPDGPRDRSRGWEVGALTALLGLPVATVRGTDPHRVGRVRAVLHALDHAVDHPLNLSPDRVLDQGADT